MSYGILRQLIDMACADGNVSAEEKTHLLQKAKELGIAESDLNFMLEAELERVQTEKKHNEKNNSRDKNLGSGFVTDDKSSENNNPGSGFISDEDITQNNLGSGFVSENTGDRHTSPVTDDSPFTETEELSRQGRMSIVEKGKYLGKWVIIKRIKPEFRNDKRYIKLFYREFENAYHLDHPHIARLLGKGKDSRGLYYFMEYVDGRPLTELIGDSGIKDHQLIHKILLQLADALCYVHKKQVFHRDLKPENILVTYRGDNVKIIDFGLAAADSFEDNLLQAGTPKYYAPEQKQPGNTIDQRTDIYALGLILLEMLFGPQSTHGRPASGKGVLYTIMDKCLQQKPADRFQSMDEVIKELQAEQKTITTVPPNLAAKVSQFTENASLSPNERKYLSLEAQAIGLDNEVLETFIDLKLEKAREKIKQQKLREKQARERKEKENKKQAELERKLKKLQQTKAKTTTSHRKSGNGMWFILIFAAFVAAAIYLYNHPLSIENMYDEHLGPLSGADPLEVQYVNAGYLNLRSEMSSASKETIIEHYQRGTAVVIYEKHGGWAKVKIKKDGNVGYMALEYLIPEKEFVNQEIERLMEEEQ